MTHNNIDAPIPLSDIEAVLAWVDTFKLSRTTKKINRDFSDAVLLAEILSAHYPKLVEMHNYPPRNSHSLKLNNWMTLNRKVLKKLKLTLCCTTMQQLADSTPGVIERVLVMVRDKIRRDEESNKSIKEDNTNLSSGGSYYEACGDEDHVLVVPVKTRVNGVLETLQQKVVNYESYTALKEELKDAKDAADVLKQKVEHLDSLIKLKDERIDELQSQLERKQARKKDMDTQQQNNLLSVPYDSMPSTPSVTFDIVNIPATTASMKSLSSKSEESKIPRDLSRKSSMSLKTSINEMYDLSNNSLDKTKSLPSLEKIKSEVFKEIENDQKSDIEKYSSNSPDSEEFKDSVQDGLMTIEVMIQNEINDLLTPAEIKQDANQLIVE